MAKKTKDLKAGEIAQVSGQYQQKRSKKDKGPERTVVKGKPLPPTPKPKMTYDLVDETKTK